MIRFQAFGISFVLPVLTLLIPLLAPHLGLQIQFGQLALALGIHEAAHILAAKATKVEIREVRLSPFGGSARMENPYALNSFQLINVALSGPLANFLTAMLLAALTHWNLLPLLLTNYPIRTNLLLFLFNLLPVLPLDGGRILYCILKPPFGRSAALRFEIYFGRFFASTLIAITAYGFWRYGKLNLSLIFSAIYILLSAQDEKDALVRSSLAQICPPDDGPLPTRIYQIKSNTTIAAALSLLRPKEASWFLLSEDKQPVGILSGQTLLEYMKQNGSSTTELSELPLYRISLCK